MKRLYYVRYFPDLNAWFVCFDHGTACIKMFGPWDTEAVANLSLEIQQCPRSN